jgi:ribosome-associated translation inhibitor RaiA
MNIEVSAKGGLSAEFKADVVAVISEGLSRYEDRMTRVEVHVEDANGPKGGIDHQCRLEARLAGMQPVAVSDAAETTIAAIKGAIGKMDRLLASTLGKMKDHKGTTSASGEPT